MIQKDCLIGTRFHKLQMVDPEFKSIVLTPNSLLFLLLHSASWKGFSLPGGYSKVQFLLAHIQAALGSLCCGFKYSLLLEGKVHSNFT